MIEEVAVSFFVGIGSNLATDALKRSVGGRRRATPPAEKTNRALAWSLASTVMPVATLFLAKERWVMPPSAVAGLAIAAWLLMILVPFALRRSRVRAEWLPTVVLVAIAFVFIDRSVPRFIAMECPEAAIRGSVPLSGRVLDPDDPIEIEYGPVGGAGHFTQRVPPPGGDGRWHAIVTADGIAAGETLRLLARTSTGARSKICTVGVR